MTNVLETVKKDKFIFFNSNKAQFIHSIRKVIKPAADVQHKNAEILTPPSFVEEMTNRIPD